MFVFTFSLSPAGADPDMTVTEVHNENIGVILVDKGMVEDHLPNHVLAALKLYKEKLLLRNSQYDATKIKTLRAKNERLYRQVYRAYIEGDHPGDQDGGFTFLISETPMVEEDRKLSTAFHSKQQEMVTTLEHPVIITADVHHESRRPALDTTLSPTSTKTDHLQLPQDLHIHNPATARNYQRPQQLNLSLPMQTNTEALPTLPEIHVHSLVGRDETPL